MSATDHGKTAFATCHGLFEFQVMPFGLCNARAPLVSSCLGYPFERIAIDIMAPLPVTESGNKYILVVGDYFMKWKEAYVSHHQRDWDGHLPLVMMAYRSSVHEVQLPVDVMFGRQPNHQLEVSEYVRDLVTPWKKSMSMPGSTCELPRSVKRTTMISELLESKSRLAIDCSSMTPQSRKGRLRSSTHHCRALTL